MTERSGITLFTAHAGEDRNGNNTEHVVLHILANNRSVFVEFFDRRLNIHSSGLWRVNHGVFWEEPLPNVRRLLRGIKRLWTLQETGKLDALNERFNTATETAKYDCFSGARKLLRMAGIDCPLGKLDEMENEFALDEAIVPYAKERAWRWQETDQSGVWIYAPEYTRLATYVVEDLSGVLGVALDASDTLLKHALDADVERWRQVQWMVNGQEGLKLLGFTPEK